VPKFVGFLVSFLLIGFTGHFTIACSASSWRTREAGVAQPRVSPVGRPHAIQHRLFGEYATPESLGLKTPLIVYNANICFTGS
jgi:hypothetical protein